MRPVRPGALRLGPDVGDPVLRGRPVPAIADDIVNVDRAMRWGFNWARGPFELLDALGPDRVVARLERENRPVPRMLAVLRASGAERFYGSGGTRYLGTDGAFHPIVD